MNLVVTLDRRAPRNMCHAHIALNTHEWKVFKIKKLVVKINFGLFFFFAKKYVIQGWILGQILYGGLSPSSRTLINTASGGSFFQNTEKEAYDILEELAYNNDQCSSERRIMKKDMITLEMGLMNALAAQVADLTKTVHGQKLSANAVHPYRLSHARTERTVNKWTMWTTTAN